MPSIYQLKSKFQDLLRPIVNKLASIGITPNQITIFAAILSIAVGLFVGLNSQLKWIYLLIPAALFIRMALNAIDGMLAREHKMQTSLGAILNELGDVISDIALYLPFAIIFDFCRWAVVAVVLLAVISEMTGIIAIQIGASRRYDGPMGKSDRAFLFGVIALLLGVGLEPGLWMRGVFHAAALLIIVTIVNRVRAALIEAKNES